jgi:hypothetical protein
MSGEVLSIPFMTSAKEKDPVAEPYDNYCDMRADWDLVESLLGGTTTMREAGEKFLPKFGSEDADDYKARLKATFLNNMFCEAIDNICAKPFKQPISVVGDLPEELEDLQKNCDQAGTNLTQFGKKNYKGGASHGLVFAYVDMPTNPNREIGVRPYFSFYPASSLIGAKFERSKKTGELRPRQIRLQETRTEDDGEFGEKTISVIRVVTGPEFDDQDKVIAKGTVQLWEKGPDDDKHIPGEPIEYDYPGIPFEAYNPGKVGNYLAKPPLMNLAHTNIEHWQSSSDQKSILHFARIFQIVVSGANKTDRDNNKHIGPNRVWYLSSKEAKAWILEHSGAAIEAGERDIKAIEERARAQAGEPLTIGSGSETATGRAIDDNNSQSKAQAWAEELGAFLERLYRHAAKWLDLELPDDFRIDVFKDFSLTARRDEDLKHLRESRFNRELSRETFLNESKKRGVISEDLDIETELERIDQEGPMDFTIGETDLPEDE